MNANTRQGKRLQGKRVAVLMTDGVEQVEYTEPRGKLEARGPADIPAFSRAIQVLLEETDVCPPKLGQT